MIEYALLVMLGFCAAGLLALLIAPTIWNRAVRLTTKRLDATLPMSLSDIEADKDLLRASYAIQIRRLEAGLNKARDKSASQLVEISKLQMAIGEMRDRAGVLEKQLEERRNAANVFERTITKRFPEMEAALGAAKAALDERAYEIGDFNNKLRRKEEALTLAQRSAGLQQAEIRRLRETLEGSSADRTGRFRKRPAQWTLEEFRSEYDRLSLELSKMRELLTLAHERETGQVAVLRGELQNLAEQIMNSVAAHEKQSASQRLAETPTPTGRDPSPRPRPRRPADRPLAAPQPWPRGAERAGDEPPPAPRRTDPASSQPQPARSAGARPRESDYAPPPAEGRRPSITDDASSAGGKPETSGLKALLDRAAAVIQKDKPAESASGSATLTPSSVTEGLASKPSPGGVPPLPQGDAVRGTATGEQPRSAPGGPEPKMDRMLREIFEGGNGGASSPSDTAPSTAGADLAAAKGRTEPAKAPSQSGEINPAEGEGEDGDAAKRPPADRVRAV